MQYIILVISHNTSTVNNGIREGTEKSLLQHSKKRVHIRKFKYHYTVSFSYNFKQNNE